MSDLRTYLEEYAATINEILKTCKEDKAIKEAAEEKAEKEWGLEDPRFLVFIKPAIRFSEPNPDSGAGDVHLPNEMPSSPPKSLGK
jgi:hypothetical protein